MPRKDRIKCTSLGFKSLCSGYSPEFDMAILPWHSHIRSLIAVSSIYAQFRNWCEGKEKQMESLVDQTDCKADNLKGPLK